MGVHEGIIKNNKPVTGMVTATALIDAKGNVGKTKWNSNAAELIGLARQTGLPKKIKPYESCTYDENQERQTCIPQASRKTFRFFYTAPKRLSNKITVPPTQIHPPPYPAAAVENGEEGTVILTMFVNPDGPPFAWITKTSGHPKLDRAALTSIRKNTFKPAKYKKQPVAYLYRLPVRISLEDDKTNNTIPAE